MQNNINKTSKFVSTKSRIGRFCIIIKVEAKLGGSLTFLNFLFYFLD